MHKKHIFSLAGLAALLLGGSLHAQSVYVVKIYDLRKEVTYEVMTREELAKIKHQVQAEGRVFRAALAAAKKEWSESELHDGTTFPGGLSLRRVQGQGPFKPEVAKKKIEALEERAFNQVLDANKLKKMSTKEREKLKEKQAREAERDALLAPASLMLQAHIERLLEGEDKNAAAPAAR